ncbi:phosphatase PAP2 family protein [Vibrio sp. MACH09]|uniref:phosphatase PAP2 family protein n=1 Tax=unclassified Vibrio TaxID=2614977 RepID=UPI0014935648|nr:MULTISPECIES: phosphatase PAP2 family protein [unclassified Vibrio]NOI66722.1 phosphatase PAP2 family protein [Vibrio sp. 99-8-1]GLO61346.1 phosphatase PAP2 family protein [Vibrio sp. MACH09]
MSQILQSKWQPIIIATIIIAIITIATRLFNLDIAITSFFYHSQDGFTLKNDSLVRFFYRSINISVTVSILFFIGFAIAALFKKSIRKHNRLVLALFISILLGPGLIVNSVFKENFGRPRPSQTVEFGGQYQPKAVLEANWGNEGKSFASGHAAVPLSFLLLAFAAYRRGKLKLAKQLAIGIVSWYLFVSYARVAAGGHHFTDVAWAGYFSFVCAWLSYIFIESRGKNQ